MKLLPINITGAKVVSMSFEFKEDDSLPDFGVTVALFDNYGKRITSIRVSNNYYDVLGKCEPSIEMLELSSRLRRELENVVTIHLNKQNKTLDLKKE